MLAVGLQLRSMPGPARVVFGSLEAQCLVGLGVSARKSDATLEAELTKSLSAGGDEGRMHARISFKGEDAKRIRKLAEIQTRRRNLEQRKSCRPSTPLGHDHLAPTFEAELCESTLYLLELEVTATEVFRA